MTLTLDNFPALIDTVEKALESVGEAIAANKSTGNCRLTITVTFDRDNMTAEASVKTNIPAGEKWDLPGIRVVVDDGRLVVGGQRSLFEKDKAGAKSEKPF